MKKDKRVFAVNYPDDGLHGDVYTNVAALYQGLNDSGYYLTTIDGAKFGYSSLLKTIRQSQKDNRLCVAIIDTTPSRDTIRVYELLVKSK